MSLSSAGWLLLSSGDSLVRGSPSRVGGSHRVLVSRIAQCSGYVSPTVLVFGDPHRPVFWIRESHGSGGW
jgi:hypothetical protein